MSILTSMLKSVIYSKEWTSLSELWETQSHDQDNASKVKTVRLLKDNYNDDNIHTSASMIKMSAQENVLHSIQDKIAANLICITEYFRSTKLHFTPFEIIITYIRSCTNCKFGNDKEQFSSKLLSLRVQKYCLNSIQNSILRFADNLPKNCYCPEEWISFAEKLPDSILIVVDKQQDKLYDAITRIMAILIYHVWLETHTHCKSDMFTVRTMLLCLNEDEHFFITKDSKYIYREIRGTTSKLISALELEYYLNNSEYSLLFWTEFDNM